MRPAGMNRLLLIGAAWMLSLACAAAAGWAARAPAAAAATDAAPVAGSRDAPFQGWLPDAPAAAAARPAEPALPMPPRVVPAAVAAASADEALPYLSGTDSDRYLALGRARTERRAVPTPVLQALLFGPGSSGLRLAALELWAESLEGDPPAQQALFEQALQVSDDAVRAEARARLDEALQVRHRLPGKP